MRQHRWRPGAAASFDDVGFTTVPVVTATSKRAGALRSRAPVICVDPPVSPARLALLPAALGDKRIVATVVERGYRPAVDEHGHPG